MTKERLMFWFGWHYDHLDHAFRNKRFADPVAKISFVPAQNVGYGTIGRVPTAVVAYDTATMKYLWVECDGARVDLSDWDL